MEWGGVVPTSVHSDELKQIKVYDFMPAINEFLYEQEIPYIDMPTANYYLSNGSRFYNDVGDSREYATPEDDSFIGTTANEIVGDQIFAGVARLFEMHNEQKISFNKRVIDDQKESRGYHASYAVRAEMISITESDLDLYGVFAATRNILFGSGALLPSGKFTVAQKTLTVTTDFSPGTTMNKPVVNLRPEPLANPNVYARVHDTSGDPTMSPWATRVKLGAASVVLKMMEHGESLEALRFDHDLSNVAQKVARDPKLKTRFRLVDGRSVTALDVQDVLVHRARQLHDSGEVQYSDEELWTIDEWERALIDLRKNPRLTVDRIDWTMRREILSQQNERHGWGWNSQRLRYKDRQFSDVAIDGIALALRETIWAKYMPPEDLINDRMHNPPSTTRANIRGEFIRQICELDLDFHARVEWSFVSFMDEKILLLDPYASENYKVDSLLSRVEQRYGLGTGAAI
jgi:hypothetical protein